MGKIFKDYYADPEYRKRHLEKLKKEVTCGCGKTMAQVNLKRHQKSKLHEKKLAEKEMTQNENEKDTIKELNKKMSKLIKLLSEKN